MISLETLDQAIDKVKSTCAAKRKYYLGHKFSDDPNGWFALAAIPDVLQSFLNVIRGTSHSMFRSR